MSREYVDSFSFMIYSHASNKTDTVMKKVPTTQQIHSMICIDLTKLLLIPNLLSTEVCL